MGVDLVSGSIIEPLAGRRWDAGELRRQVAVRIRSYRAQGFEPGDRALILFASRLEFFADLFAVWRLGGCLVPVDPSLTPFEIGNLAQATGARFCIVADDTRPESVAAIPGATVLHTSEHGTADVLDLPKTPFPRLDDDVLVIFTGGTTGRPKGAVLTWRAILSRVVTLGELHGTADFRRSLCLLPIHSIPLVSNCIFPLLSGCDLYVVPPFQPQVLMKLGDVLDRHGITYFGSVPSMWNLVFRAAASPRPGSLARIHCASASLLKDTWLDVQRWSGIPTVVTCYGTTETASWSVGVRGREVVPESDFIGEPWGCRLQILPAGAEPADGEASRCAAGQSGMVWLAGAGLMSGYLGQPELTERVLRQGWYLTEDVGYLDDRGQLYVQGRARDEINRGGVKVYPAEIDHVATQCQGTADACAFRVPDELYGENVAIALVLTEPGTATVGRLYRWLESRLARHKMPARWYRVDSLPRTERGKINRESVMKMCESLQPIDLKSALQDAG
jgi:acyl-CoA synthetase (AMP-forming)/AMP-acid ligase II